MLKKSIILSVCSAIWFLTIVCYAETESKIDIPAFKRIALMPFLMGKLESPDKPIAKPLNQPLSQMFFDRRNFKDGAEQIMTNMVNETLRLRFSNKLIPPEMVTEAYHEISQDQALDTPRKLAVKLNEKLAADLVVVGTVWQFREKNFKDIPDRLASVALILCLVDVTTGKRLWRKSFNGTQKVLSEDVLGGLKQIKMGLRLLSANELARYRIKEIFRKFPLQ